MPVVAFILDPMVTHRILLQQSRTEPRAHAPPTGRGPRHSTYHATQPMSARDTRTPAVLTF